MTAMPDRDALARLAPALAALTSAALLLGALAFQYLGGLPPCVLCIWQRWAHVAAIVPALLAAVLVWRGPERAAPWLLALAGLAFLAGAGIAGFHVGVEQQWWQGTASCGATSAPATLEDLKRQLMAQPIVRCDAVAWSLAGISMAGYNMLASAALGAYALWAAARLARRTG